MDALRSLFRGGCSGGPVENRGGENQVSLYFCYTFCTVFTRRLILSLMNLTYSSAPMTSSAVTAGGCVFGIFQETWYFHRTMQGRNFTPKSGGDRGSGTYGERVEREPITGVWGQSPWWGARGRSPLKLKGFGKTTSKSVHKFSTFTTVCE